jgi:hypothetical protein
MGLLELDAASIDSMNMLLMNLRQIQGKHVRQPINYKYYSNSFELI